MYQFSNPKKLILTNLTSEIFQIKYELFMKFILDRTN